MHPSTGDTCDFCRLQLNDLVPAGVGEVGVFGSPGLVWIDESEVVAYSCGQFLALHEWHGIPSDSQSASVLELRNNVKMHIHHFLVSETAVVLEHVVGSGSGRGHDRAADSRQYPTYRGRGVVRQFMQMHSGFLRNNQDMSDAEGADIKKGQHMLILMDSVAGDLSREDPGKDGFTGFIHGFVTSPEG